MSGIFEAAAEVATEVAMELGASIVSEKKAWAWVGGATTVTVGAFLYLRNRKHRRETKQASHSR